MLSAFVHEVDQTESFKNQCPLKYIMVAGEAFPKSLVKDTVALFNRAKVENIYGPTESSIYSAWFSCSYNKILSTNTPIGSPLDNTKLYILDKKLNLKPIGIPGELYISGAGLARGYLNLPDLAAEKFIDNPLKARLRYIKLVI